VAPVFSIITEDIDSDGLTDIMLFGNFYGLKPEGGRLDANDGVVLKGLGDRKFEPVPSTRHGLNIHGEVRDAVMIPNGKWKSLVIARNNLPALIYTLN